MTCYQGVIESLDRVESESSRRAISLQLQIDKNFTVSLQLTNTWWIGSMV